MRLKLLSLLMFIAVTAFSQNSQKIKVPGFGELVATPKGDKHSIKIADYGTFDFKGSLNPINLKVEVTVDQLKEFPGYKILNNLGLQDVSFELSKEGLTLNANADTEKNLKELCQLFKVSTPTVDIEAKIGKGTFELSGELAFSKEPIKILEIKKTGAKLSYYSAALGTAYENGSFELIVSTTMLVKPSKFDPALKMNYQFGYDLIKQTLTGSASMMSEWIDPFGMDMFFNKNSVIFSNAGVELGVNIPALSISKFGYTIDRAKFFDIDFGTLVSVSPLDGEIALWGKSSSRITLNQIPEMLRKGFGLKTPNIFPTDYYLDSAEIKFAPTGGTVGQFELDKGFTFKGAGKFKELNGFIDFNFDLENEFRLEMDFKGDYSKFIWNEAHKIKNEQARKIIKQALDQIQIQRIYMYLNAQKNDMTLKGEMTCEFKYQNKLEKISFKASLDAQQIAKNLIDKLLDKFGGQILDIAKKAGKEAEKIAKNATGVTNMLMADAKTISKHTHSKDQCDKKCVPKHARNLSTPIVDGSFDAVRKFYFSVFPTLGKIKGSTPEATRKMRSNLIKEDWDKVFVKIDADWSKVINDKTYIRFYFKPESAGNGGNIYRKKVKEYRQKDLNYRKKVWERMMTNTSTGKETAKLKGTKIPKGAYYIQSVKAGNSSNGYLDISYNKEKKTWKKKGQRLQIWTKDNNKNKQFSFHKNKYLSYYIITPASDLHFALDCKGRKSTKKTPIHLWSLHKGASQQFFLKHIGGGKFAIVPKSNHKMCLALVENKNANKGNKVHLWTYSDAASKQWYLINAKTGKKFVPKQ